MTGYSFSQPNHLPQDSVLRAWIRLRHPPENTMKSDASFKSVQCNRSTTGNQPGRVSIKSINNQSNMPKPAFGKIMLSP
jgi:hypothetical protein